MLIGLAVMFATARLLGPDGRGVLAALSAWVAVFATLSGLSLGEVSQYRIQKRESGNWLPEILGTLLVFAAVLSALAGAVAYFLYQVSAGSLIAGASGQVTFAAFLAMPLLICNEYLRNLLFAAGRSRTFNILHVTGGSIGLGATIVLLMGLGFGVIGAVIGQLIGLAIIGAAALAALMRAAEHRLIARWRQARDMLNGSAKLHLNAIGTVLLAHTDTLMLNRMASSSEVGWYQLGYQLVLVMLIIPQAGSMILYSRMAEIGPDRLWPEQKRLIGQTLLLLAALSAVAYLAAPFVLVWLGGPAFAPTVEIFRWLLPVVFGMSMAQLMAPQWIGRGIFLPTSLLTVAAAAANAVLNYFWIPRYGMLGAAWATLVSFLGIVLIVQICFAVWCDRRHLPSADSVENDIVKR